MHIPKVLPPIHFTTARRRPTSNPHHLTQCRVTTAAAGKSCRSSFQELFVSQARPNASALHVISAAHLWDSVPCATMYKKTTEPQVIISKLQLYH